MQDQDDLIQDTALLPELTLPEVLTPAVWPKAVWAGVGSSLALLLLLAIGKGLHQPLLLAPFGASCVLLFLAPDSPLAQPRNVLVSYAMATLIAFAVLWVFPGAWWAAALAVGATIFLMTLTHTVHPPAGAHPIVILLGAPAWKLLLPTLVIGLALLMLSAWAFHRFLPTGRR